MKKYFCPKISDLKLKVGGGLLHNNQSIEEPVESSPILVRKKKNYYKENSCQSDAAEALTAEDPGV